MSAQLPPGYPLGTGYQYDPVLQQQQQQQVYHPQQQQQSRGGIPVAGPSNHHPQQQPLSLNGQIPQTNHYSYSVDHQQQQQPQPTMTVPFPQLQPITTFHTQHQQQSIVDANGNLVMPSYHLPNGHGQLQPQPQPHGYPHIHPHPHAQWRDDWSDDRNQEMVYNNLEVKHRRRTTPDQLRILEYWYNVNPKPDNSVREHLAMELGMTKRNVQVWFQNRRAKMKTLAKKEEEAAAEADEDGTKSPNGSDDLSSPIFSSAGGSGSGSGSGIGPLNPRTHMARRASLANGEAAKIQTFVAKRAALGARQQQQQLGLRPPGLVSPLRSPLMNAAAARRGSIASNPYPSPMTPISPIARVMPSALHIAAMRNNTNTRRSSVPSVPGGIPGNGSPAGAQLISSGPFTPPRVVSNHHQVGININMNMTPSSSRELLPIKDYTNDDDSENPLPDGQMQMQMQMQMGISQYPEETDFFTSYITPPASTYLPSSTTSSLSYHANTESSHSNSLYGAGAGPGDPPSFSPNSPLPNPQYSFGAGAGGHGQYAPHFNSNTPEAEAARQHALFMEFQQKGRLASITSNVTTATEDDYTNGLAAGVGDWFTGNVAGTGDLDGFDPDSRRASAPADLLHQINLMALANANGQSQPMRPSPLGNSHLTYTSEAQAPVDVYDQASMPMSATTTATSANGYTTSSKSGTGSEGPSPPNNHNNVLGQGQGQGQLYPPNHLHQRHTPVTAASSQGSIRYSHSPDHLNPGQGQRQETNSISPSPFSTHSVVPPPQQQPAYQQYRNDVGSDDQHQQQQYQNQDGYNYHYLEHPHPHSHAQGHEQGDVKKEVEIKAKEENVIGGQEDEYSFLNDLHGDTVNVLV